MFDLFNRRLIFFLIHFFLYFLVQSNNSNYYFKQISVEQGLSQSTVNCLHIDDKGIMWIGTNSGLNIYTNHAIKFFMHDPDNMSSLPGNTIRFIVEDANKTVWINTNNGLVRYDNLTKSFSSIVGLSGIIIESCLILPEGMLFSAEGALYFYRYDTEEVTKRDLVIRSGVPFWFDEMHLVSPDQALMVCKNEGLFLYEISTEKLTRHPVQMNNIIKSCVDKSGNYTIASYKEGVRGFNAEHKPVFHLTTNNSDLPSSIILDMIYLNKHVWIGTDGGGIFIIDPEQPHLATSLQNKIGASITLPNNSIKVLYSDNNENMWFGTVRDGVFGLREVPIQTYQSVSWGGNNGISNKIVNAVFEDNQGLVWIGTDGGGINMFNPATDLFYHFEQTKEEKIASIANLTDNRLLVSLYQKGIFEFDKNTGELHPFEIVDKKVNENECLSGFSVLLENIGEDICIMAGNIYFYSIKAQTFRQVTTKENRNSLTSVSFIDESKDYYLFKGERSVFKVDKQSLELSTLLKVDKNEVINSACFDGNKNIWIGSNYGLSYFDIAGNERHLIPTKLFHSVSGVFLDDNKRIWISAQNELFSFDKLFNQFTIWDDTDGFNANEIISSLVSSRFNPSYYFGGVSGFVRMNKDILEYTSDNHQIELNTVVLDGKIKACDNGEISIPFDHNSLTLSLNVKNQDIFSKEIFRYTISGYSPIPVETYDLNINLPHLPPGNYTIQLSSINHAGVWSDPEDFFTIHVIPPWYLNLWILALFLIIVILLIAILLRYLFKRKEEQLKWKIKEHEINVYEEKVNFLINISHELRTSLTLIYTPLKRLMDNRYDQTSDNSDAYVERVLTSIYKQSKEMNTTINMVLDMDRLNKTEQTLNYVQIDLREWVNNQVEDFKLELEHNKISVQFYYGSELDNIWMDAEKCKIILTNMLMNSLKFSPKNSIIKISIILRDKYVRISLSDQGPGLGNTDSSNLFERFYRGESDKAGSGIGLAYAKSLAELHEGYIGAFNNSGAGATFYFEIPFIEEQKDIMTVGPTKHNLDIDISLFDDHDKIDICTKDYSILFVEDKKELRTYIREELQGYFHKIYVAKNGEEALILMKSKMPDLVISDVMMPVMNGFELCRQIKNDLRLSHIPVVLLTARSDNESFTVGYRLGADAYLPKPFDVGILISLIRSLLNNRKKMKAYLQAGLVLDADIEFITTNNADEAFLKELNTVISNNIHRNELDVNFIMKQLGMSRTPLYNKVKALTDLGVNEYINTCRINKAKELLANSDISVSEISERTGFTYQRYFSTTFKQLCGVSPSQYRKSVKESRIVAQN